MSASNDSILIKGGVLLFAAGFSCGRLLLGVVNGNRSGLVYGLIAILLVPLLAVDGICIHKIANTLKQPLPPGEKRKRLLIPALGIVVSILGLLTGYITFSVA